MAIEVRFSFPQLWAVQAFCLGILISYLFMRMFPSAIVSKIESALFL